MRNATAEEIGDLDRERAEKHSWRRGFFGAGFVVVFVLCGWWSSAHKPVPPPYVIGYDRKTHEYTPLGPPQPLTQGPSIQDRSVAVGHYVEARFTIDNSDLERSKRRVLAMTEQGSQADDDQKNYYNDDETNPFRRQPREHVAVSVEGTDCPTEGTCDTTFTLQSLSPNDKPVGPARRKRYHVELVWVADLPPDELWWNPSRLLVRTFRPEVLGTGGPGVGS